MIISSKLYDFLKPVSTIVLPAIATLYLALSQIWGLPAANQVVQTVTAVDLFLGAIMALSSRAYNAQPSDNPVVGSLASTTNEDGKKLYSLVVNGDPEKVLDGQTQVTFTVNNG